MLSDWLISLEGTVAGHRLAMALALWAAFAHALFGALQKGRFDPWLSRAAIDAAYALMALPIALFLVPWPEPHLWPILAGAFVIHAAYKTMQAATYTRGAYLVVYPVVRAPRRFLPCSARACSLGNASPAGNGSAWRSSYRASGASRSTTTAP